MAERPQATVSIGRLNIRLPGDGRAAGRRLAQDVSDHLANSLASGPARQIDALTVRVPAPRQGSSAALGRTVAAAVMNRLGSDDHG